MPTSSAFAETPLDDLPVVVLDCQTTASTPQRGVLLELAWAVGTARSLREEGPPEPHARLLALPAGERLPPRISALTGIGEADLADAPSPEATWRRLLVDAGPAERVAVAHFARFERAFLEALHPFAAPETSFPFEWLCTHEVARRLLPGLPRRGLRAVAGYLGHVMAEAKRAAAHVEATCVVWAELTLRLAREHGVVTLADLRRWTEATRPARLGGREYALPKELRLDLPDGPGVYRMLGKGGEVLYVGKATSLRARVNSYFQKKRHGRRTTAEFLTQTWGLDVDATATPLEAALLEADEIKRLAPPYNVQLRGRRLELAFVDRRLESLAPRPDERHVLGPFPSVDAPRGLVAASRLLTVPTARGEDETWQRALGLPADADLEGVPLTDGLALFARGVAADHGTTPRGLLGWAARAWRVYMSEQALRLSEQALRRAAAEDGIELEDEVEEDAAEDATGEEERDVPRLPRTSEDVSSWLASRVRYGAQLMRRGAWLRRLSESGLVWRPRVRSGTGAARAIVLEGARLARAVDVEGVFAPRAPPGWPRSTMRRLETLDAAAYDRLRVLTTELRRLVAEDVDLALSLGPHRTLDRRTLALWLAWV